MNSNHTLYPSTVRLILATGVLLLIPLIAMQLSAEVVWTFSDFVIAGSMLFGTGFTYLLVTRVLVPQLGDNLIYRVAVGFALFIGLFLIWSNLAVGIIGSENNAINLLYFGVIFVGIIGGFMARFRPLGMARTMFAMAIAQALIAVTALVTGMAQVPGSSVVEIVAINSFFIMLFVVAALLFRYARQEQVLEKA